MPRGTTEQPQVIPGTLLALLVALGSCSLVAGQTALQLEPAGSLFLFLQHTGSARCAVPDSCPLCSMSPIRTSLGLHPGAKLFLAEINIWAGL